MAENIVKAEKIEELKKELQKLKTMHKEMWDNYGSELCAGDMHRKEKDLEDRIDKLSSKPTEGD